MDDESKNRTVVALPGVCCRVLLPMLPNFLATSPTGGSLPIGELAANDVTLLGMAWQRELRDHWRQRAATHLGMSPAESRELCSDVLHPATANRVGRRVGCPPELVQSIMRTLTEELTHG